MPTAVEIAAKLDELRCTMPGYMRVTPKIARKLLERTHELQRPVVHSHVTELVNAIRSGVFKGHPQIQFNYELKLVDGQHTLLAIIELKREMIVRIDFW